MPVSQTSLISPHCMSGSYHMHLVTRGSTTCLHSLSLLFTSLIAFVESFWSSYYVAFKLFSSLRQSACSALVRSRIILVQTAAPTKPASCPSRLTTRTDLKATKLEMMLQVSNIKDSSWDLNIKRKWSPHCHGGNPANRWELVAEDEPRAKSHNLSTSRPVCDLLHDQMFHARHMPM